ncbi:MAG: gliding motility-associated C-terminal domain-containing protein [Flavobacteriales bacterium]|jgi:gliding motility-associated-like protein|nr:gliding motility-associated C-terminal domain-containing protein [Flavobacteriales bacterium]
MKNFIITGLISVLSLSFYGQTLISAADTTCDCSNASSVFNDGSNANFQDAGGGADYSSNENEVITFCPDAGASKVSATFATNSGFSWDVDASDTLYVYDGPSTSSPLIGAYNSTTDPNGFFAIASWNNPSGCLTFQFVSNGSAEGTGWDANISCGNPPQPFEVHMEGFINGQANGADDMTNDLNPVDTGYIDICLGDSIMLVANPVFPHDPSVTGNGGYDQIGNHTINWEATNGFSATGDTVWFKPTFQSGYLITLSVVDAFPQTEGLMMVVRVSTTPSFTTCTALDDTICEGQVTQLVGGITPGDTVGVQATTGAVEIGGTFASLTFLPDGSGQNYTTDVSISGFPANGTIQSATDINRICLSMEHSFLGDLEMMLTCPNGQSVTVFNSYTGSGLFPGGFGGGGTYLGGANDTGNGTVGVCEEYCFSEMPGSLASWAVLDAGTGIPTSPATGPSTGTMVTPGTYNPEESFFPALQGCPINGNWTITVRDNLGIDDGYICEWGIFFDATLNPNNETYTASIVNEFWSPDPTIITGDNDTAIIVQPPLGTTGYTFNVEDSFGCAYDTTVLVEVIQGPSINSPTTSCLGDDIQFSGTYAPEGGNWSFSGPGSISFFPNTTFINPKVTADQAGTYSIIFMDNQCGDTTIQQVTFLPSPTANIVQDSATICSGDSIIMAVETSDPNNVIWLFNGDTISNSVLVSMATQGVYTADVSSQCGSASDAFELFVEDCRMPNVITPNGDGHNDIFYTNIADNYTDTHVTIFNRWGRKVYENTNYDNSWNGVNKGGAALPGGVYYYVLTYNGGSQEQKGFITLIK